MRFLIESKNSIVFYAFFSIAVFILIGVPTNESVAKKHEIPTFDSEVFTNPLTIDNPFMPLVVGTTYLYSSETEDGTEEDTVTVTSDSEMLGGVNCRAVSERRNTDQ